MKNIKKWQFPAKKLFLGMFILVMVFVSFGQVFAQDSCDADTPALCADAGDNCFWDNNECFDSSLVFECSTKETWAGCVLKRGCVWYGERIDDNGTRCKPRSSKLKAKATWDFENNCHLIWNEHSYKDEDNVWQGAYENKKTKTPVSSDKWGDYKYFKELDKYNYVDKKGNNKVKVAAGDACEDLEENSYESPCDYPNWLNDRGKRLCRNHNRLKEKAIIESCYEKVENLWQRSLKDEDARYSRELGIEKCDSVSYIDDIYRGPIFDGPGLRGGSQMAQMELSNSISKQRDLKKLLIDWSKFAIEIAFVLAVIAIIWAGFRYITDLGDGSGVEAAKKIIIWTVVGILVILGAYAIVNTVITTRFDSTTTGYINTNIKNLIT